MKEEYISLVNKYFKRSSTTKKIFIEQIENYHNCQNNNKINYNIGDTVYVNQNTLIHGTRLKYNELNIIKEKGLIASEFYKGLEKKKKPFIIEYFNVDEKLSLKDYLDKYPNGCTITLSDMQGKKTNYQVKTSEVFNFLHTKDYRDYVIYQNQEQRFLPNTFLNHVDIAFILTYDKDNPIYKYNMFDNNMDKRVLKTICTKWYYNKYMKTRVWDNRETGREKAFLFGISSCMIEGILVSKKYEEDIKILNSIKEIFPNSYICNLDGVVIK